MKPVITIMVGLPRSGKSTYVNKNYQNTPVISADQLRLVIYGQRFWKDGEDLVWTFRKKMLQVLLQQKIDIVIDETNTIERNRSSIINMAIEHGYTVNAVVIVEDPDVCIKRAKDSGQEDLELVIKRMAKHYEPPHQREGIEEIKIIIDNKEKKL